MPSATIPISAGQARPTVDHKNRTAIKIPRTFIPTGVRGGMGGSIPNPNMKNNPINV